MSPIRLLRPHPHDFVRAEALPGGMSRREFLALSSAAAALPFLGGCGGGNDGSAGSQQDFFSANNVVVRSGVVVLPEDGSVTINDVSDSGLTISGAVPAITVGQVIAGGPPPGTMRKVLTITPNGTSLILTTEPASFAEVFESADIRFRRTLDIDDGGGQQILLDGVTVTAGGRSRAETPEMFINIPKTFLGTERDNAKAGVEITASGFVKLSIDADIQITRNGVRKLEIRQGGSWNGEYKIDVVGKFFVKKEVPYYTKIFRPIRIGQAGPVPIFILPVLFLQIAIKLELAGAWETSGNGTASYEVGLRIQPPSPRFDIGPSDMTVFGTGSSDGTFHPVEAFNQVTFEVSPWQLELQTSFEDVIGPKFNADLPSVAATLKAQAVDLSIDVSADAILRGKVGAKAGMVGLKQLPLFETTLAERKFNLFHKNFKPGSGNVGVH